MLQTRLWSVMWSNKRRALSSAVCVGDKALSAWRGQGKIYHAVIIKGSISCCRLRCESWAHIGKGKALLFSPLHLIGNAGYFLYKKPLFGSSTIILDPKLLTNVKEQIRIFEFLLPGRGKAASGLLSQNVDLIACTRISIHTSASFRNFENSAQAPSSASIYLLGPPEARLATLLA